jgi:hypothetical protein
MIDECPEQVRVALRDVIVLRAEMIYHADRIEYVGVHPSFAVKPDGEEPGAYVAEIKCKGDGSVERVTWKPV